MEILSDATFKGNVSIKGETDVELLKIIDPDGYPMSYVTVSEFSFVGGDVIANNGGMRLGMSLSLESHGILTCSIRTNYIYPFEHMGEDPIEIHKSSVTGDASYSFNKPWCQVSFSSNKDGFGICMSGKKVLIPIKEGTVALTSDIPSLSDYQKKFTTFSSPSIPSNCTAFEFTGTAISDTNKTHLIQVQNTSTGRSVIAETWMTTNKKPAMSFAGCTSTVAAGTYTAIVL